MTAETHSQVANFIWSICNLLRGPYKRNEYRKVILPLMENGTCTIKELEESFAETPRRTLQRDLKKLVDAGLLEAKGATHQLSYMLSKKGL